MEFDIFYGDFLLYLKNHLQNNSNNRVNGIEQFLKYVLIQQSNGCLDSEYDNYTEENLKEIILDGKQDLISTVKRDAGDWLEVKSDTRWVFITNTKVINNTNSPLIDVSLSDKDLTLLYMDAGILTKENIDELELLKIKLESLPTKNMQAEATCSFLIAEAQFNSSNTFLNAKNWNTAGNKNKDVDSKKAVLCYERAGQLYSECFNYAKAAYSLKNATDLIKYDELTEKPLKDDYKKLLIDCRVQFERAGLNDEAADIFIEENNISQKESKFIFKGLLLKLFQITANYGESPFRVFISAIVLIIISTAVYYCAGLGSGTGSVDQDFGSSLYFSIVTFTTLGYGDLQPLGWVRVMATIQAVSGLVLTSLFMVTLVRKYSR